MKKPPAFPVMPLVPMSLMSAVVISNIVLIRRLKAFEAALPRSTSV
jgi:hypothetical protein